MSDLQPRAKPWPMLDGLKKWWRNRERQAPARRSWCAAANMKSGEWPMIWACLCPSFASSRSMAPKLPISWCVEWLR